MKENTLGNEKITIRQVQFRSSVLLTLIVSEIFHKRLPYLRSTTACSSGNALSTYSIFSTILIVRGFLKIDVSFKKSKSK